MRYAGSGSELWRVRVDLFDTANSVPRPDVQEVLRSLLGADDGEPGRFDAGADSGRGIEGRPVLGLLFWVRADHVGDAASIAVETALRAARDCCGENLELYDLTLIPRSAVVLPEDPHYPVMPD
jgi:hypothetical protein